jgi:hypothetical protein
MPFSQKKRPSDQEKCYNFKMIEDADTMVKLKSQVYVVYFEELSAPVKY